MFNFFSNRKYYLTSEMIISGVAMLAVLIPLFLNIFAGGALTYSIVDRVALFAVFVSIATYFIRNTAISRDQEEKLGEITEEMTELNKKLQISVRERTYELEVATIHTDTVIENLTVGLIEYDNNFTLLRINNAAEEILGVRRDEVLSRIISTKDVRLTNLSSLVEVTYPILSVGAQKSPEENIIPSLATTHEISIQYPEARNLQIVTLPLVEKNGHTTGLIKIIRDITREKLIAKSKSEFITIAAHQLRTPLSIMKWVLGLFLSGEMGNISDQQKDMLTRSHVANEKMIGLVNSLLDVTRVESGKFGYTFTLCDLAKIIGDIILVYEEMARVKGITFSYSKPEVAMQTCMLDAEKISLAITKIIDNAFRYTSVGGKIDVSMRIQNDSVILEISDTGIGISKEYKDRVFEKFFRTDESIKAYAEGSGLGLYIARSIISRHKGTMNIKTEENTGTTVTITLPFETTDES